MTFPRREDHAPMRGRKKIALARLVPCQRLHITILVSRPEKKSKPDRFFRFHAARDPESLCTRESKPQSKEGKTMNPLIHFKKTKILRNAFLSLSAIFALAITADAQNLYVSANVPGGNHAIFEYTTNGTQSIYASGLDNPRGLAFDTIGNLFATTAHDANEIEIGKVLKFNLRNHVSTAGSAAKFFFQGLATDIVGNTYVLAN